ncbi:MAG: hypothetical protein RMJ28_05475 [Nitrososphaerota archaeon]|nr:hypothetical protein [Candidatus Calditenuaceae archaeon]MDW8073664.1 hypothetical protein [Nitrososphaerota archaeon]
MTTIVHLDKRVKSLSCKSQLKISENHPAITPMLKTACPMTLPTLR